MNQVYLTQDLQTSPNELRPNEVPAPQVAALTPSLPLIGSPAANNDSCVEGPAVCAHYPSILTWK